MLCCQRYLTKITHGTWDIFNLILGCKSKGSCCPGKEPRHQQKDRHPISDLSFMHTCCERFSSVPKSRSVLSSIRSYCCCCRVEVLRQNESQVCCPGVRPRTGLLFDFTYLGIVGIGGHWGLSSTATMFCAFVAVWRMYTCVCFTWYPELSASRWGWRLRLSLKHLESALLIKTMIIFCCFLSYTVVYLSLSLHTMIHYLAGSRQDTKTQRKKTTKHRTAVFHDF